MYRHEDSFECFPNAIEWKGQGTYLSQEYSRGKEFETPTLVPRWLICL